MTKPISVVLISHPKTTAIGKAGLSGMIDRFEEAFGCKVSIKAVVINNTIPPGQVYLAQASEPWARKMGRIKKVVRRKKP